MIWSWKKGGIVLGLVFFLAVWLVKPIGVSTQYVIADGIVGSWFSEQVVQVNPEAKSGFSSPNAYLNKSGGKYAANIANPLSYGLVFVLSMIVGGGIASRQMKHREAKAPDCPINRGLATSLWYPFIGGFVSLFGARLAGGCTSGHMMSGMMQSSLSGYVFAVSAFAVAVPTAMFLYLKRSQ
ncbi:MAG: YeeE/YedE family protein [Shewanella sp.]|nr:YeeE/YedE family protein [Shewanella sp.]